MMKKFLFTFVLIVSATLLFACGDDLVDYNSYFEEDRFTIPLETDENITLPNTVVIEGVTFNVSWESNHPEVLNASGIVIRPTHENGDVTVTLTANVTYVTFTKALTFTVVVNALPANTYYVYFNSNGSPMYHLRHHGILQQVLLQPI